MKDKGLKVVFGSEGSNTEAVLSKGNLHNLGKVTINSDDKSLFFKLIGDNANEKTGISDLWNIVLERN